MKSKIMSRKLLLSLLLLAIGTAIEAIKPGGLSSNFLYLLMGMGTSYQLFNVTSKGVESYTNQPKVDLDAIKTLLSNADKALLEVNKGQEVLFQNAQSTNQALATILNRSAVNGPTKQA